MSAEARNYVYRVKVTDANKKEETMSRDTLEQYRKDVAAYLEKRNGNKN